MPGRGATADQLFLERDDELARIEHALKAAADGSGAVVVVSSSAGLGKTRLLDAAVGRARELGLSALTARGAETEQDFSFGVVLQLLQRAVASLDVDARDDLLGGAAALARPLLEGTDVPGSHGPEAAFGVLHGLYWLVANLAERGPLLLAIDDVHWADAASINFIVSLANRLDGLAVTILLAQRLGEHGPGVGALDTIRRRQESVLIDLGPLSDESVRTLVRATYDASAGDALCRACALAVGGNPLYLRELLAELRSRDPVVDVDDIRTVSLESISRFVHGRLFRAGPEAVRVAQAASVADGAMALPLVARIAAVDETAAERAVRALTAMEILAESALLTFVHPLVRNAIYMEMTESDRRALHRLAAELLRGERAQPERIAAHLQLGDRRREAWAVETLTLAAASAMERASPSAAASYLRSALAEGPDDETRPRILAQLGIAGVAAGDADAVDLIREAIGIAADVRERVGYFMTATETLFVTGRYAEAISMIRRAYSEVHQNQEVRAGIVAFIAGLGNVLGVVDESALAELPILCDRITIPTSFPERLILTARAGLASLSGELSSAGARNLAARALEGLPGDEIKGPFFAAAMALWLADDYAGAERALDASMEASIRGGRLQYFISSSAHRSELYYRMGRIDDAIGDAEASLHGSRYGIGGIEPVARAILGVSLLDRGTPDHAEAVLRVPEIDRWAGLNHLALLHEARGHLSLERRRPEEALAAFHAARDVVVPARADNPTFCSWRSGAALALDAMERDDAAREIAIDEVELAKRFGARRAIGIALRARGLVEESAFGLELLHEAVDVLAASDARLEHARALTDLGGALRRSGFRSDARAVLRTALDRSSSCGAQGLSRRARAELVAAGGKPRRERLSGVDALTPQERRIAELATRNMSNREIAQSLFLTRKTIETHLSNAYAKLGIRSRDELAQALRRNRTS